MQQGKTISGRNLGIKTQNVQAAAYRASNIVRRTSPCRLVPGRVFDWRCKRLLNVSCGQHCCDKLARRLLQALRLTMYPVPAFLSLHAVTHGLRPDTAENS